MSITLPTPIDMMHLPPQFSGDVQFFLANNQDINWQAWVKPRGVTMCFIVTIGGGGRGGAGHSRTAGTAGGGGGGGGSGGLNRLLIPAMFLPEVLYVQVGLGGLSTATGTAGAGSDTTVSLGRSIAIPNLICKANGGARGGLGTVGAGGAGGAAGASVSTASGLNAIGLVGSAVGGQAGGNGGAQTGANGAAVTAVWNGIPVSGGAGGAGSTGADFAGGAITLQGTPDFPAQSLTGGLAGSGTGLGSDGSGGIELWEPFAMTGGSGGGSTNNGTAGNGGNGAVGCGGGGGGAGVTGGRGGDGGNGAAIIISW